MPGQPDIRAQVGNWLCCKNKKCCELKSMSCVGRTRTCYSYQTWSYSHQFVSRQSCHNTRQRCVLSTRTVTRNLNCSSWKGHAFAVGVNFVSFTVLQFLFCDRWLWFASWMQGIWSWRMVLMDGWKSSYHTDGKLKLSSKACLVEWAVRVIGAVGMLRLSSRFWKDCWCAW